MFSRLSAARGSVKPWFETGVKVERGRAVKPWSQCLNVFDNVCYHIKRVLIIPSTKLAVDEACYWNHLYQYSGVHVLTISGTIIKTLRFAIWTLLFRLVSNSIPSVGLLCNPIRFANRFRAQKHI